MNGSKIKYFNNYGSSEKDIKESTTLLNSVKEIGYFKGENNKDIYYEKYILPDEKGKIVISHGFTEFLGKYEEIIYYFLKNGYSVFGLEHRGHGRSGCFGKIDKTQVTVEKFDYYIEDLKKFLDEIVKGSPENTYLYAHSMGGAIGCIFLERYNGYFKKAILSTPMFKIKTGKISNKLAKLISGTMVRVGKGEDFIFGQKCFDEKFDLESAATSNEHRYRNYHNKLIENAELRRGGGSFTWLSESIKATEYLIDRENISNIDVPILLFQAGRDDFVEAEGHNKFNELCKNCNLVRFDNGKHELYLEMDEILHEYLDIIFNFIG
ncbi:alpha/beta fold hydrolase [Clostridium sp.]|uniref:alpha/beta fold hydrolase n=1 Tax=Clostridium sp. TaxID=1506 RepID=UPI0026DCB4F3|nr:alpha/beta hydrolase [Clostridium sp.]MDO5040187.1 alpha/beta hydrolase [Clostridium sp.]